MTNQPDRPKPDSTPGQAAPPPFGNDGTAPPPPPATATPIGRPSTPGPAAGPDGAAPISGQPWSTPSGDAVSPQPYQPPAYAPGYAAIPEPAPDYPPTAQFPAQPGPHEPVNYAPPGYTPDYGQPGYEGGYGRTSYEGGPPDGHPGGYPPPGQPGYGPSSHPGYGPPDHGPPGYGQPPSPPPKRSNVPLVAVILAVSLLLCGGVATAAVMIARNVADRAQEAVEPITEIPDLPTEIPDLPVPTQIPGGGTKISVTYEVSGDGPAQILYLERIGDAPVRLDEVKLPWKFTTEMETPALISVVAVRASTTEGKVSCRALVNGDEVKQTSSGQATFATASCTHLALN